MIQFEKIAIYWVNRLSALTRRDLGQRFKAAGYDISPEEWAILLLLWQMDEQSPGEMSARTVRDPTTMTRLVDGMVRKAIVVRRTDKDDRRRSLICLTKRGHELQPILTGLAAPMLELCMDGITPHDAEITVNVLTRMVTNISQHHRKKGT
ncbi:MAG: MarR family winged helix-turn-helix transcriptional regulator [Paracoccaceae bacterium]